jgi:hypothetical protein
MLGSFYSFFVDKKCICYFNKLDVFASILVIHTSNINWLLSVTVLGHCSHVSLFSRTHSGVSYYCSTTSSEFCFLWCRVWSVGSSGCWHMKRSCCWEQEGFRMDGGIKKKLKLNPRINASPLSLITFGYDTALYISSVLLFMHVYL